MDEKLLVQKAQSGDFDAFSTLVDAHKGRIFALALKITGNEQDAEDIVQETLLKAIDNIDKFRGESAFGSWLYAIALNQAKRHYGEEKRAELLPIEDYLPSVGAGDMHSSAKLFDWLDPHKILESDELRSIIDNALSELPPRYREVFLLRYYEELPVKEIAAITKQSVASAKSRILRARLALRDMLSQILEVKYE
jgi:RNA polymerase sigma-70 factor (ECF subfamily)